MKYRIVSSIAACLICIIAYAQKKTKAEKATYDFPAAMIPAVKEQFTKECDKGQILYGISCVKCHNVVAKNKEIIPDFAPEQLKGYELRVSNQQHEANMPDELVTAEELAMISTFLTYKKKSGVDMKK